MPSIDFDTLVLAPCMATFGDACLYAPAARAGTVAFTGVFEEFHVLVTQRGDGAEVLDTRPVLGCRDSDFARFGPPRDEELVQTADGRWWLVDEVLADGVGHLKLMLKVAPNQ